MVIGIKKPTTKKFILKIIDNKDDIAIKHFIRRYIYIGNFIVSNNLAGYAWLNYNDPGKMHIAHIYGYNDFGSVNDSTAHIESLWLN